MLNNTNLIVFYPKNKDKYTILLLVLHHQNILKD